MTPEELSQLTPEQRRVRIAELCGLTLCPTASTAGSRKINGIYCNSARPFVGSWQTSDTNWHGTLPKYDEDLNACAEMEATLTDGQHGKYRMTLVDLVAGKLPPATLMNSFQYRKWFSATAAQRCEAFLLTVG